MNKFLSLLLLISASTAHAETIGDVEYQIPNPGTPWTQESRDKKEQYETVVYIPAGTTKAETKEFFGAIAADRQGGSMEQKDIEADLLKNFPDHNITVKVLEKNAKDVTYEWNVKKDDFELSGITKGFNTGKGIVVLSYQVFGPLKDDSRTLFVPLLKSATLKK
jgi:hypothetical protein